MSTKHEINFTHYTNFGHSMAPNVADNEGFVEYRDGFRDLPEAEWTRSEKWIANREDHIDRFNSGESSGESSGDIE